MKENIKLFLKSLVSNNACIDGARKKPWYAAVIIFFISIVLSVIPTSVMALKSHADKNFDSNSYGLVEASHEFGEYTSSLGNGKFYVEKEGKTGRLVSDSFEKETTNGFVFTYTSKESVETKSSDYINAGKSFFIFTEDTVYVYILDPNTHEGTNPKVKFTCINAYKKVGRDDLKTFLATGGSATENAVNTFNNFKGVIRKLHRQSRLQTTGIQVGVTSAITVGITLIMGFMVWILTRGKNNPYRLFTVWQCFSTAFWASFTPALLSVGLGFLIKNFAQMIFPLLMGVRVMWLTMKSLRPDGSGYAAN